MPRQKLTCALASIWCVCYIGALTHAQWSDWETVECRGSGYPARLDFCQNRSLWCCVLGICTNLIIGTVIWEDASTLPVTAFCYAVWISLGLTCWRKEREFLLILKNTWREKLKITWGEKMNFFLCIYDFIVNK